MSLGTGRGHAQRTATGKSRASWLIGPSLSLSALCKGFFVLLCLTSHPADAWCASSRVPCLCLCLWSCCCGRGRHGLVCARTHPSIQCLTAPPNTPNTPTPKHGRASDSPSICPEIRLSRASPPRHGRLQSTRPQSLRLGLGRAT